MKYSGSDFKFTSQANHLAKLLNLKAENHRENIHAQRLYKRRKPRGDGSVMSNWMTLNQSAIDDSATPQSSNAPGKTVFQEYNYISIYQKEVPDDGEVYDWEPIRQ
jgi:hypothetical protein